jgi:very-short-patch-repair endonuclease
MALPPNLITNKTARLPGDYQKQVSAALQPKRKKRDFVAMFLQAWSTMIQANLYPVADWMRGASLWVKPDREYYFHPTRRWRFDLAWPQGKVAVEFEGLTGGKGGRHQRMAGYQGDVEKYREAAKLGWLVLRYTGQEIVQRPVQIVEEVVEVLKQRSESTKGAMAQKTAAT